MVKLRRLLLGHRASMAVLFAGLAGGCVKDVCVEESRTEVHRVTELPPGWTVAPDGSKISAPGADFDGTSDPPIDAYDCAILCGGEVSSCAFARDCTTPPGPLDPDGLCGAEAPLTFVLCTVHWTWCLV